MGHVTVGTPYDDKLNSMPWKGVPDYSRSIQCERLRETVAKDNATRFRDVTAPLGGDFVAAQGLPTHSLRRPFGSGRSLSPEQVVREQHARAKMLAKYPRQARELSPDRLKPRRAAYVGPTEGPQLLGRKGPNCDADALPYSELAFSPGASRGR